MAESESESESVAMTDYSPVTGTVQEFELSPERFRLYAYATFAAVIGTSIVLTKNFADLPEETIIKKVFGYNNVCVYFDYPPASYVVPPMWAMFILLWLCYGVTWSMRVGMKRDAGLLSKCASNTMQALTVFECISALYSIMVHVSKPFLEKDHVLGLAMHMHPFTIFIVALFTNSLKNVWYLCALNKISRVQQISSWCFLVVFFALSLQKVVTQINAMFEGGLLWVPNHESYLLFGSISDKLWTVVVFIVPATYTGLVELKITETIKITGMLSEKAS